MKDEKIKKRQNNLFDKLRELFDEEFRTIKIDGNETQYLCSNYGRIFSLKKSAKQKELAQIEMPNGYMCITLRYNNKSYRFYIHRLVAMTFIDIPKKYSKKGLTVNDLQVNHIKGKHKWNNSIMNLEWATDKDNKNHAYRTGLSKSGEDNAHSIYTEEQIISVCELLVADELKPSQIKKMTGVSCCCDS